MLDPVQSLNAVYSSLSMRRRYEVWFLRFALADGSGAWWFRYLLLNPGRAECGTSPLGSPLQVWASWFPRHGKPQSFIQGFPLEKFRLSARGQSPFRFEFAGNAIDEDSCSGQLRVDGHEVSWAMRYRSTFQVTLSAKGWIGFSRTPHSDAIFSGHVLLDGEKFEGQPLGFGLQGHNCGYRHRSFWRWTHAYFAATEEGASTFEALVYDLPFGMVFRKAVLWHKGQRYLFRKIHEITQDRQNLLWSFEGVAGNRSRLRVTVDGRGTAGHRLPYLKTDCSGDFEVVNNSLAKATLQFERGGTIEELETSHGAVLEMGGQG